MKRRSKIRFTQIHVSVPVRLLEDYDDLLAHGASRSKAISYLMRQYLDGGGTFVSDASMRQLMSYMMARDDCDPTLYVILRGLLISQTPDEQSS